MLKNWGGNLEFVQGEISKPESIDQLAALIRSNKVRPIGTLHSFSPVVAGEGVLLSAAGLKLAPTIDAASKTVRVAAASRYGDIALALETQGLALRNMGSLPHISLAGASATGTHGSGDGNRILSASLLSFSFLNHEGELVTLRRGDELFEACRLGLGAYGLWVEAELSVVESYQMRQDIYRDIPWQHFLEDPARLTAAGYSVSLFGKWGTDTIDQAWVKTRIADGDPPTEIAGVTAQTESQKELAPGVGDNLTEQGGKPGPWLHRLPHFRLDATPSAGDEIQTEYFFTRDQIVGAIEAVHSLAHEVNPVLIISEIRSIAQDDAWLSPMRRGDSIALHFTFKNDVPAVARVVEKLESALAPFNPIPHWGKVHGFTGEQLAAVHPTISAARKVFDELDPEGKFNSPYLRALGVRS
jgi:xylitol oxidase